MIGQNRVSNERRKDWLGVLITINSFGSCEDHEDVKFNEKNVFCVDCAFSLCRHCKEAHSLHRKFQIYRYCYQDVVRHSDLLKYFDCSNIQTYISNNDKIVHLKPRPPIRDIKLGKVPKFSNQPKEAQTSLSTPPKSGGTCKECGKHLQDARNRFCSIKCKISVLQVEPLKKGLAKHSTNKIFCSQRISEEPLNQNDNQNSENESSISVSEPYECVQIVDFRKMPRKSTPHRSPLM